jgi:hypothetical protein
MKLVAPQDDEFVPIRSSSGEGISINASHIGPGDHTETRYPWVLFHLILFRT